MLYGFLNQDLISLKLIINVFYILQTAIEHKNISDTYIVISWIRHT